MSLPTTITQVLKEGKLMNSSVTDKVKLDTFLEGLNEGDQIKCTYEIESIDGTYAQLSRLHASIRAIAAETGASFEEMKLVIKQKSGLVIGGQIKSFGDCSKEELGACIQTCIEVGDFVSCNLR